MSTESVISGLVFDVTIAWGAGTNVGQWTLQRSLDLGVSWGTAAVLPGAVRSFVDHNVPHVELRYRVIAQNSVGPDAVGTASRVHLPFLAAAPKLSNVAVPDHPIQIPAQVDVAWTPPTTTGEVVAIQIVQRSVDQGVTWQNASPSLLPSVASFRDTRAIFAQLQLSWPGWQNAVQYVVERSADGVTWSTLTTTTSTSYTDPTPLVNQYSHYRVTGQNSVGSTLGPSVGMWLVPVWDHAGGFDLLVCTNYLYRILWINNVGATGGQTATDETNPPVLQLVVATSESPQLANVVSIRALPAGDPNVFPPYFVERDTDATPQIPALLLAVVTDPTYTDTAIVHGHKYTYHVVAGIYTGPNLATYSAGPVPPAAPKVVQDPLLPYVDLFWLPSYQTTTYAVERSTDAGVSYQRLAAGLAGCFWADTTLATDIAPTAQSQVRYRIVSADALFESIGAEAIFTTYATPPSVPALALAAGQITVSVQAPAFASLFVDVERRTPDAWDWSVIHTFTGVSGGGLHTYSYVDTAMTAYQRYYYRAVVRVPSTGAKVAGLAISMIYKAPGDGPGFRIVVAGVDVSAQVERGSAMKVDEEITQKGGTAGFRLDYDPNPPQILTR